MIVPFIYKKPIILSLLKIATLKFTMYILTILTYSFKTVRIFLYKCNHRAMTEKEIHLYFFLYYYLFEQIFLFRY